MEKILVIEDNLPEAKIIVNILKKNGYEATFASDGMTGIRDLENNFYDLVLTDLMMPDHKNYSPDP